MRGWIACLPNTKLCGVIDGGGLEGPNEAASNLKLLESAYNMGKNI